MTRATGSDRAGPSTLGDGADTGHGAMPAWAARHLAEAAVHPDLTPPGPGRHRYRRGRRPDEPSRLRGWALATAAVAAAVGTVPMAVAALSRQDEALPRVETFPVVAPVDIGRGEAGPSSGTGTAVLAEPGPDAAGSLPTLTEPAEAGLASPRVAPTAAARPWHAPRSEEARIPRVRPPGGPDRPGRPDRPPSTSVTPTTDPDGADPDPREDQGGTPVTEPRDSTPSTTTTTTPSRGRHAADDDDAPSGQPGLLGSTVREVSGLLR